MAGIFNEKSNNNSHELNSDKLKPREISKFESIINYISI